MSFKEKFNNLRNKVKKQKNDMQDSNTIPQETTTDEINNNINDETTKNTDNIENSNIIDSFNIDKSPVSRM